MEVAKWLQLSRATVYKLIREGKLPAFRMGSDWRFSRKAIAELMQIREDGQ
jgi:excisionase family DNA binding protein